MSEIGVLIIVFVLLLILPIVLGHFYYKKRQGEVLFINQAKTRDPRYFGKSYSSMIRKGLSGIEDDEIQLSKKEKFIDGDKHSMNLDTTDTIDRMVICREKELIGRNGMTFKKEVYSIQSAHVGENTKLRAIYSESNIIVEKATEVMRWLDAEGTVAIYDDCNLGISTSSAKRISIGQNCDFRRIYSPEIFIGQYPGQIKDPTEGKDSRIYRLLVQTQKEKNIRYISNEMINEEGIVDSSILSSKNVSVTENIIVKGDISTDKGVRLFEGAIVVGNIFAEKDVILGKNSCVIGNVFSQGNITLETGAAVGRSGAISSVIARGTITLEPGTFVFGYLSSEKGGKVLSSIDIQVAEAYAYLEEKEKEKLLVFKDLNDYEGVSQQGFRFHQDLEEVIIPEGARKIPRSMFYKCTSLEKIYIPDSIEEIEDFAFGDCNKLKEISLIGKKNLRRIGVSAFGNCSSLEDVEVPESVEIIDAAAFAGCTNLTNLSFAENSLLKSIKDHAFKGCTNLGEVKLESNDLVISDSSFMDCENINLIQILKNEAVETGV